MTATNTSPTAMRTIGSAIAALVLMVWSPARAAGDDIARLRRIAAQVTITRDDWGIAHIHGHTDAQAVFGMVYAQAEDDFNRIEMNYLVSLGRVSEFAGPAALPGDLRARLYIDPADLQARTARSPGWLKALMTGWADGLNYYLATHPAVTPKVIRHFEPWMALSFSEGSIGGDIESIELEPLARFYDLPNTAALDGRLLGEAQDAGDPTGSNGIAIAPANTANHHAMLLINPHTSFYFRSELQMTSDAGLNAYGAATWGQFFLYQGFNDHLGWMHTSSHSDAVDAFLETIVRRKDGPYARFGARLLKLRSTKVSLSYRTPDGGVGSKRFTVWRTSHGPIVGQDAAGHWISEAMMFRPVEALEQSYAQTRARDFQAYRQVMELQANTSNNTVYADADGHIAYLHPQFIPRRDDRFDYRNPVDGADPRTAWNGLHRLDEAPHLLDPRTGWIQNTNNWPYSAAGSASPKPGDFPRYMDSYGENVRGLHAVQLLQNHTGFTLEGLVAAAYDPAQPGFDILIPRLLQDFDAAAASDPIRTQLADQILCLRRWDRRASAASMATTLAVTWGETLWRDAGQTAHANSLADYAAVLAHTTPAQRLHALASASAQLMRDFGTWRTAWGDINRVQRLTDDLEPQFSDAQPSLPVGFTSAQWGSLASIVGPREPGVKRRYGNSGNSFVAAIEFGPHIRAVAISAGGENGHPGSPHFNDQGRPYSTGALREVYFYPGQLAAHTERRYHPGG